MHSETFLYMSRRAPLGPPPVQKHSNAENSIAAPSFVRTPLLCVDRVPGQPSSRARNFSSTAPAASSLELMSEPGAKARKERRGPAPPNPDRPSNNVQVGKQRSNFVYADLTKHLLANGEKEVEISALGSVIADCVAVVEMLKNQGMVTVKKIETSRGTETHARRDSTDKIAIWVVPTPAFPELYKKQMEERAAKESGAAAGSNQ